MLKESTCLAGMINETTDITNQEQAVIAMHRIDASFEIQYVKNFWVSMQLLLLMLLSLFAVIKDTMLRFTVPMSKL